MERRQGKGCDESKPYGEQRLRFPEHFDLVVEMRRVPLVFDATNDDGAGPAATASTTASSTSTASPAATRHGGP